MADQMQAIKRRMRSVSNTERITNAMKLVAASKLKHATTKYMFVETELNQVIGQLHLAITGDEAPLIYKEECSGKTLYLLITGSKGLCGGYNATITKEVLRIVQMNDNACYLSLGTKGNEFLARENCEVFLENDAERENLKFLDEPIDDWSYKEIRSLSESILDKYKRGEITKIIIIYTKYVNTIVQRLDTNQLFPLKENKTNNKVGVYSEDDSNRDGFFDCLAEEYLTLKLYNLIAEATLCEHSARRMAMKNASDNAKEMLTELSVYYNRARQAAITNELIEIVAGAEALKNSNRR